jgi:hypothetical protein
MLIKTRSIEVETFYRGGKVPCENLARPDTLR